MEESRINLRLEKGLKKELQAIARENSRTLTKQINHWLKLCALEYRREQEREIDLSDVAD